MKNAWRQKQRSRNEKKQLRRQQLQIRMQRRRHLHPKVHQQQIQPTSLKLFRFLSMEAST